MAKAVFTGSFDPFTIGHAALVRRALPMFERIIIGVGVNENKKCMCDAQTRVSTIARLYAGESRVEVKQYSDLTVDFAHREGATFIIKGLRSVKDMEYQREQAIINMRIGHVETLLLFAEPEMEGISSSMVRELIHFGRNVDEFLPTPDDCKLSQ